MMEDIDGSTMSPKDHETAYNQPVFATELPIVDFIQGNDEHRSQFICMYHLYRKSIYINLFKSSYLCIVKKRRY